MRRHEQLSLEQPWIEHRHADELVKNSQILTLSPGMSELVEQDLVGGLTLPEEAWAQGQRDDEEHLGL